MRGAPDHDRCGVPEAASDLADDPVRVEVVAQAAASPAIIRPSARRYTAAAVHDTVFTQAHHADAGALGGGGGDRGRPEVHTKAVDHRVAFPGPT